MPAGTGMETADGRRTRALRFVVLVGVMSFFADFTYEGSRGILGPYLALLGASGTIVGIVTGFGELCGYGLRLVSGRLADRTKAFWPITIAGYIVQMAAVPALALAHSWTAAAILLVLERVGKATRNPPRDVMISHAGAQLGGLGWAFGLHEALDQSGALFGPLLVAIVLARHHDYRVAFAVLLIPALIMLTLLAVGRLIYPHPEEMEPRVSVAGMKRPLPRRFWIYLSGAALVAAGFADYPLLAFHFQKTGSVPGAWVPVAYAIAMGVSGGGSLAFGKLFDQKGLRILIPLTLLSALYAPLVFFSGFRAAIAGVAIWGLGMGVHESIMPAAVAPMVLQEHRASAYGLFTGVYGLAWFLGSVAIGIVYDHSVTATAALCLGLVLASVPFFFVLAERSGWHTKEVAFVQTSQ
jgi:predicted MFS family arabinose efflux permease